MRIEIDDPILLASPERPVRVGVTVTNDSTIIDAYTARIVGIDAEWVRSEPRSVSVFPDSDGRLELTITVPRDYPAGRVSCILEVSAQVATDDREHVELQLIVEPVTAASLTLVPALVSARHRGTYSVACTNDGNTPVELVLAAGDAQRALSCDFEPPTLEIAPGATATALLDVQIRRRFFGADLDHILTVTGHSDDLEVGDTATLRHKPVIPRGVVTAAILASIVALWALAFLFGVRAVMRQDPKTKVVPASYFAPCTIEGGVCTLSTTDSGAPPAGAVSKTGGSAPPGVAATVHGLVTAKSTGAGVGRITVQAYRLARTATLVASAATGTDGKYAIGGLYPGKYRLLFRAQGYTGTEDEAVLGVGADVTTNAQVSGKPAALTGHVDTGSTIVVQPVVIRATPTSSKNTAKPPTVTTDANGNFNIPNLPSPAAYDLTFVAFGYQVVTSTEKVGGGEIHVANTVKMVSRAGQITGLVTDGKNSLGGVTITTLNKGKPVSATTPTVGTIGSYVLTGLETPQNYVVTFTKKGYGTVIQSVDLGPGEEQHTLNVALVGGTGTISGTVRGLPPGRNATITANGGTTEVTTTTVTADGTYQLSGLPTPATYAITMSAFGFASQTTAVRLATNGFARNINFASLSSTLGHLVGIVKGPNALANVSIVMTDGKNEFTSKSVSSPTSRGFNFAFPDVATGAYSVTFHLAGYADETRLVFIHAGEQSISVTMQKAT